MAGERVVRGFDAKGDVVAYVSTTPTTFPELYIGDRRVTDLTDAFEPELVEPERFTATSADGTEVEAWLVRPQSFDEGGRYPVVLNIHGGPFSQYGNNLFDEFQVQAGAGYAVVYANLRGRLQRGVGRAIRGPIGDIGPGWGTVDYEDLMAVTDEALKRFEFLDRGAHRGHGRLVRRLHDLWIVGHTHRFTTAISERAVNNLFSAAGSSDFLGCSSACSAATRGRTPMRT